MQTFDIKFTAKSLTPADTVIFEILTKLNERGAYEVNFRTKTLLNRASVDSLRT